MTKNTTHFILLFVLMLFVQPTGLGQTKNNGFYGKKAILQCDLVSNTPLFNNIFMRDGTAYKANNGQLIEQKDRINFGFRINAGYAFLRNFALLMEYGQEYSSAYPEPSQFVYDEYIYGNEIKHEMVDVLTHFFIPKIELATANALLPMGVSHQIGVGLAYSKVQEKDYLYQTVSYDPIFGTPIETAHLYSDPNINPIDFDRLRTVKKTVIYYGLNVRTPLNHSLLLTYGLKYMLQIGKAPSEQLFGNTGNEQYTQMIEEVVARHRSLSFIHLSLGLSFAF